MDQEDPEKRIAELERQLADARAAAGTDRGVEQPGAPRSIGETTQHPRLTAADVQNVGFSTPPRGKRGYNEDEVDAFLDRVVAKLSNPRNPYPTASDVETVTFSKPSIRKRGYNEDEVDAFLDLIAAEIRRLDGTAGFPTPPPSGFPPPPPSGFPPPPPPPSEFPPLTGGQW